MIIAANSSLTRVAAYKPHRKPAGHLHRVRTRAGGGDDRDFLPRASILSITVNLPAIQSAAVLPTFGSSIAAVLPRLRELRRSVEPTRTHMAPLLRIFVRGQRTILNLCRAFKAAGKPSFSDALVQHPEKSGRSGLHRLFLAPAFLSVPVVHGKHHDSRRIGNGQKPLGEVRNAFR